MNLELRQVGGGIQHGPAEREDQLLWRVRGLALEGEQKGDTPSSPPPNKVWCPHTALPVGLKLGPRHPQEKSHSVPRRPYSKHIALDESLQGH